MRALFFSLVLRRVCHGVAWITAVTAATATQAQNQSFSNPPSLAYVYPAGAQQGTKVAIALGGQRLRGAQAVYIHPADGISAKVLDYERPLTANEYNKIRDEVRAMKERRRQAQKSNDVTWSAADEQKLAELEAKGAARANRITSPAHGETVRVEITVAPDAAPGPRELRLQTATGLSNPFAFSVGELPEFSEPLVKATSPRPPPGSAPRAPIDVTLPVTINGQLLGGEIDRYRFAARRGQQLTVITQARALIPYLADAVPGWFQATLTLRDDTGRELAYCDDFRFHPDPVLAYTIPADGHYTIEINDAIYRGREDFVYRIALGELPFITSVFPLGTSPVKPTKFALRGWHLDAHAAPQQERDRTGELRLSVQSRGLRSNSVPLDVADLTATLEAESNNNSATAMPLAVPAIVNGRIGRAGDVDVFRIRGRAGETLVAEVLARRLDSPLDSYLEVTDATGVVLASNDDHENKSDGLLTHHADSCVQFTFPRDGEFLVCVRDTQHRGGAEFGYRLHLRAPQPDFALRVVPATLNARAGGSVPFTVHVARRDGFNDEIALGLLDAPAGVVLSGGRIPAGQDKIQLTLTAPSDLARATPILMRLAGRAEIGGHTLVRVATPADDMMQAFFYTHLVPAREWVLFPAARGASVYALEQAIRLVPGARTTVKLRARGLRADDQLHVDLQSPAEGFRIVETKPTPNGVAVTLECDASASPARGNLILAGSYERPATDKNKRNRRVSIGCAPAIPFEIASAQPAGAR